MATLTYVYAESTAVLGPLATYAEPHCYDLCQAHSERLTAPRGWEVVRLAPDPDRSGPSTDDLEALADAVRESARPPVARSRRSADPAGSPSRAAAATCGSCAPVDGLTSARRRAASPCDGGRCPFCPGIARMLKPEPGFVPMSRRSACLTRSEHPMPATSPPPHAKAASTTQPPTAAGQPRRSQPPVRRTRTATVVVQPVERRRRRGRRRGHRPGAPPAAPALPRASPSSRSPSAR